MALTKPSSGDPGYSGATKASTVIGAIVDALNQQAYSVKAYGGAAGDGSTDDTAAIHNTRDTASTGGTVYFPAGNYKVTGLMASVASQTWVLSPGTTITLANSSNTDAIKITANDVTIQGHGTIDANGANQTTGQGINMTLVSRITIRDVRVINAKLDNVFIGAGATPCTDVLIEGVTSAGALRNGLGITSLKRGTIINYTVESATNNGIDCEPGSSTAIFESVTFINPTVITSTLTAMGFNCSTNAINAFGIAVINPTILATTGSTQPGIQIQSMPVTIRGGYITGTTGAGVNIANNSTGARGVRGTVIDGVTIEGCATQGITIPNNSVAVPDVKIVNCTIQTNGNDGIFGAGLQYSYIAFNTIRNNGTPAGNLYGILLQDATGPVGSIRNSVISNKVFDDQGTPTQVRAIVTTGAADYNFVIGNIGIGTTQTIVLVGANNVNANNELA